MNMKHIKAVAFGAVALALTAGVATAAGAVATGAVNVRTGPGTGYHVVDVLRRGEVVNLVGQSGSWCKITKSGPDGWVSCAYLGGARGYGYRDESPNITLQFGFGYDDDDMWDDHGHHHNNGGWNNNNGPHNGPWQNGNNN